MTDNKLQAHLANRSTQFFYGFGSIAVGIKNNLLGTFLLIYYNQVLGLDALTVSAAFGLALIIDAVSDPIIGIWSDRTSSKYGRRHPFLYASIIPFSLAYYYLIAGPGPGEMEQGDLFWRLVFLLMILRISMTLFEVPRGALAPELSKDYDQRNTFAALSMMFGWIGGAGIDFIARYYWLDTFVDFDGYQILAFWGGVGIFIGTAVTTIGTHKNIPDLYQPPPRSMNFTTFISETKETLSNRSWLVLFTSGIFYSLLVGLESGVGTYYNEFLWQWEPKTIAAWSLITPVCVIALTFFAPVIAYGRNKKNITVGIFCTTVIVGPMPIAFRLIDTYYGTSIIPPNGSDALWYLLAVHGASMAALGALGFVFIGSMVMDITEQVEQKTGRREEGLLGTVSSFVHKVVGAGGVMISGLILSISGFDNPDLADQLYGGDVINRFAFIHLMFSISIPVISTALVLMYDIDRGKHNDHISDLGYVRKD